jgi:BRCA1-associated protein
MPAYFYHLAFELYPQPQANTKEPYTEVENIYLPPTGTDLFRSDLPVHRITPWGAPPSQRPSHRRANTNTSPVDRPKHRTVSFHQSTAERPPSRVPILANSRGPGNRTKQPSVCFPPSWDWRFESITIESIDMAANRPRGKSQSHPETPTGGGLDTRATFVPADAKNTDIGWGVVHLYRDAQETPGLYDEEYPAVPGSVTAATEHFNDEQCTTLCILAVPSYMMPSDLLGWVGETAREDVSHFRLIRTGKANRYMVLMKFREAKKAKAWRSEWNGKLFNSMEPEYCHVVFVQSITFQTGDNFQHPSSFPNMSDDPFIPKNQPTSKTATSAAPESSSLSASLTTKPLAPPTPALVELPTCPVCLERMDETTGLLTILCQHVFHCACLEKWRGSGCPVCRYTQNSSVTRSPSALNETENVCSVCSAEQNLWICLICGNVGCGRYDSAHAFAHYESTAHSYAMDVTTQHVWDYTGDGYVHRLIQNKSDGHLVDLPAAWAGNGKGMLRSHNARNLRFFV